METHTGEEIVQQINARVTTCFGQWTIGIMEDPDPHRENHPFRGSWRVWRAKSSDMAVRVLQKFTEKGMQKDSESGPDTSTYIYIY